MRYRVITIISLCLLISACAGKAMDKGHGKGMDMQAMMEAYQKASIPSAPHQQLVSLQGNWTTRTKEWMDPNRPPRESTGTCDMKMLLGGRFLQQECRGTMMGHPFTGIGTTGYDNIGKKYVSTWMDSMATGIFLMEGTASTGGKTITLFGEHEAPGGGHMKHRAVWTIPDSDNQIFVMYGVHQGGPEMKMMEIAYTRKE